MNTCVMEIPLDPWELKTELDILVEACYLSNSLCFCKEDCIALIQSLDGGDYLWRYLVNDYVLTSSLGAYI